MTLSWIGDFRSADGVGNLMNNDTNKQQTNSRIEGTLHRPQHAPSVPREAVNLPKKRAEESEVAGRHENSAPKDHKRAR